VNSTVRNVLILLLLTAAVVVLPGGGQVAALVGAILSIAFAAGVAFFAGRTYLERRLELYSLEERHRAILYGAIAGLVVTLAAASRLAATGPGALALVALLGLCGYGLFYVYQAWRQY
jgi:hypothetical protein